MRQSVTFYIDIQLRTFYINGGGELKGTIECCLEAGTLDYLPRVGDTIALNFNNGVSEVEHIRHNISPDHTMITAISMRELTRRDHNWNEAAVASLVKEIQQAGWKPYNVSMITA